MITIDYTAWGWPQWAMLGIYAFTIAGSAYLHGRPKTGTYSVGSALFAAVLGLGILWAGGVFG